MHAVIWIRPLICYLHIWFLRNDSSSHFVYHFSDCRQLRTTPLTLGWIQRWRAPLLDQLKLHLAHLWRLPGLLQWIQIQLSLFPSQAIACGWFLLVMHCNKVSGFLLLCFGELHLMKRDHCHVLLPAFPGSATKGWEKKPNRKLTLREYYHFETKLSFTMPIGCQPCLPILFGDLNLFFHAVNDRQMHLYFCPYKFSYLAEIFKSLFFISESKGMKFWNHISFFIHLHAIMWM